MKSRLTLSEYYNGIISGNSILLAQAITLVESTLPQDQDLADELLSKILPVTGNSIRIGITGIPGVGKSTFIESFGKWITSMKKKVAVLTVDPSSQITRGSILGDKTRMEELSKNELAFIRPSSSGTAIGGVTAKTREAILLCEAAGYEVIIVETVGVGQSEVMVKNMVDFFLLLMIPGAGDELQGLKKGIIEMADAMIITKADGDNVKKAKEAQAEYQHALHLLPSSSSQWKAKVLTCSALTNNGIGDIWKMINEYMTLSKESGFFKENREEQNVSWLHENFNQLMLQDLSSLNSLSTTKKDLETMVRKKEIAVSKAARELLHAYHQAVRGSKS